MRDCKAQLEVADHVNRCIKQRGHDGAHVSVNPWTCWTDGPRVRRFGYRIWVRAFGRWWGCP